MYILTQKQLEKVENFVKSIEPSTTKGSYEKWLSNIIAYNGKVTTQNMEEFVSLANGLGAESQHFPQEFLWEIKNGIDEEEVPEITEETEAVEGNVTLPKKKGGFSSKK